MNLILAAKAHACLNGQFHVSCDDVAAVARPIFRHRLIPNFAAQSEGVTADDITKKFPGGDPEGQEAGNQAEGLRSRVSGSGVASGLLPTHPILLDAETSWILNPAHLIQA